MEGGRPAGAPNVCVLLHQPAKLNSTRRDRVGVVQVSHCRTITKGEKQTSCCINVLPPPSLPSSLSPSFPPSLPLGLSRPSGTIGHTTHRHPRIPSPYPAIKVATRSLLQKTFPLLTPSSFPPKTRDAAAKGLTPPCRMLPACARQLKTDATRTGKTPGRGGRRGGFPS